MILIILISFFLLLSPCVYAEALSIPMGEAAPDFTLSSVDGDVVSLSELKGNVVILLYWRPGQNRSILALKDVKDISRIYKKKGIKVVSVIAGTENPDEIKNIIKNYEIDFPVLLDSGRQVYGDYGVRVYPSTVIIDKNSILARDIPGHAVIYRVTLEGHVRYLLGEIDDDQLTEITSPHKKIKDKSALESERKYNLALKFAESGLVDQAISSVKKSIEVSPNIAKSHILLGFLLLDGKEADDAVKAFNKALQLDSDSHDAKTGLGGALILKGDLDRAIEVLSDAVTSNPYPQKAYYELGRAYELKGDSEKSIKMLKKALEKTFKNKMLPSSVSK